LALNVDKKIVFHVKH